MTSLGYYSYFPNLWYMDNFEEPGKYNLFDNNNIFETPIDFLWYKGWFMKKQKNILKVIDLSKEKFIIPRTLNGFCEWVEFGPKSTRYYQNVIIPFEEPKTPVVEQIKEPKSFTEKEVLDIQYNCITIKELFKLDQRILL
eukprot:jgi/Orpsp1_1/1181255/evm.model.c7180000076468.1